MIIPGDTGYPWRLNKFVEYQHKVRSIHPITLCEYVNRRNLDEDDCIFLAWLMSVTYGEITSILMFETIDWRTMTQESLEKYWEENKPRLIFGSARKHAKNQNWFVPLMVSFKEVMSPNPSKWVSQFAVEDEVETYERIEKEIHKIKYCGRFAGDLFLEMLIVFNKLGRLPVRLRQPSELDWKNCANLTSAVFNIMYMDDEADQYDKHGMVQAEHVPMLNKELLRIQKAVQTRYPDQESDLPLIIGKLCSFRNLFKQSRYGGFHHDRQLGNIRKYEQDFPNMGKLWEELFDIRRTLFDESLLGEVKGWNGIRKDMKKIWTTSGKTGVEGVPDNATKEVHDISLVREEKEPDLTECSEPECDSSEPYCKKVEEDVCDDTNSTSLRNPIQADETRFMIVDPYSYRERKQVDKTFPRKIEKIWKKGNIDFCYFPVEPFHYREPKRHATQIAMEKCVELNIPMSLETRRNVPDWAVDYLTRNRESEIRISMNTLDPKLWKSLYPSASTPTELLDSFVRSFSAGVFTILKIAPIIPGVISPFDIIQVVDTVKNWTSTVEICFASFDDHELTHLKNLLGDKFTETMNCYYEVDGRWYVTDELRQNFLEQLDGFAKGWKLQLKILNEICSSKQKEITLMKLE